EVCAKQTDSLSRIMRQTTLLTRVFGSKSVNFNFTSPFGSWRQGNPCSPAPRSSYPEAWHSNLNVSCKPSGSSTPRKIIAAKAANGRGRSNRHLGCSELRWSLGALARPIALSRGPIQPHQTRETGLYRRGKSARKYAADPRALCRSRYPETLLYRSH